MTEKNALLSLAEDTLLLVKKRGSKKRSLFTRTKAPSLPKEIPAIPSPSKTLPLTPQKKTLNGEPSSPLAPIDTPTKASSQEKKALPKTPLKPAPLLQTITPSPTSKIKKIDEMRDIEEVIKKRVSHYPLSPPPSDKRAHMVKNQWKFSSSFPKVPLFVSKEASSFRPLLESIAEAISLTFVPSRLIDITPYEEEKSWHTLFESTEIDLILIPDITLWETSELITFYKEFPQNQSKRLLGNVPLLLLPDLSLYLKAPLLKRSLWNLISQHLKINGK